MVEFESRLSGPRRLVLAAGLGALTGLVQAPVSWPWMCLLTLPALFWLLGDEMRAWPAFRIGWAGGTGYFAVVLFWIVEPFLVDIARHGWMAPFALVAMAGGLSLFWGAAFAATAPLGLPPLARALALASAWTLSDYARAHLFGGFPWGQLAYGWIGTPVAQALSLVGPHGLDFLILLAAFLVGVGRWRAALGGLAIVAGLWGFGAWRLTEPVLPRADGLVVRAVQPNAAQHLKWQPELAQAFYERLLVETAAAPERGRPGVVVWPETAVPFLLDARRDLQVEMAAAAGPDSRVILGIRRMEWRPDKPDGEGWFNSLVVLSPGAGIAQAVYDKHHLVPFGEYIPLADQIARLGLPGLTGLTGTGFDAGPGPEIISTEGVPAFLPLICYEAIFTETAQISGARPDWFVQVTNDAWFGTVSGPYQHLAQAQARAIEYGLPLVRSANTGISAIIDTYGRIIADVPLGRQGHADAVLPAPLAPTPYSSLQKLILLIVALPLFLLTLSKFYSGLTRRHGQ